MYSDEWMKQGYSSSEKIRVSDFVFFSLWHDKAGIEIGASVDFETVNDFHYELPISEWQKFKNRVLRVNESDDVPGAFRDYFVKNDGLFDFEGDLTLRGIVYQKIFF